MKTRFAQFYFFQFGFQIGLLALILPGLGLDFSRAESTEESFQKSISDIQNMKVPPQYKAKAIERLTRGRREVVVQLKRTEGQKKILTSRKPIMKGNKRLLVDDEQRMLIDSFSYRLKTRSWLERVAGGEFETPKERETRQALDPTFFVVRALSEGDVNAIMADLSNQVEWPEVDSVEKNLIDIRANRSGVTPDDPYYQDYQWQFKDGFSSLLGFPIPNGVSAPAAWEQMLNATPEQVVVAVIDTGVDIYHEDLQGMLYQNPGEMGPWQDPTNPNNPCHDLSCNWIDDDGNGVRDDVNGFDFAYGDYDIRDYDGHGTVVSGIIGARSNNTVGVSSSFWDAKVFPIVGFLNTEDNLLSDVIASLNYARTTQGIDIVNLSWSTSTKSKALQQAVQAVSDAGILVVAAASNEGQDFNKTSLYHRYPAAFSIENMVVVAAHDREGNLLASSNTGKSYVNLAAPGDAIYSTMAYGDYNYFKCPSGSSCPKYDIQGGTSYAAAHVSGAAALLKALNLGLTAGDIKNILLTSGDPVPGYENFISSKRKLNLDRALKGEQVPDLYDTTWLTATPWTKLCLDSSLENFQTCPTNKKGKPIVKYPVIKQIGNEVEVFPTFTLPNSPKFVRAHFKILKLRKGKDVLRVSAPSNSGVEESIVSFDRLYTKIKKKKPKIWKNISSQPVYGSQLNFQLDTWDDPSSPGKIKIHVDYLEAVY